MAGGIYKVKNILFAVVSIIQQSNGMSLYSDTSFPFKFHIIEELILHFAHGDRFSLFKYSIRESRLTVVDMSYYTEIPDLISLKIHFSTY